MELKDLVKYYLPMRMEGSSPPNWEVVFGYDISKFKGYNVDEVRVALNLTQLWLSQGPRGKVKTLSTKKEIMVHPAVLLVALTAVSFAPLVIPQVTGSRRNNEEQQKQTTRRRSLSGSGQRRNG